MKITLKSLVLKNFKGIRDLHIDFAHETDIFGDNATGKTTLFDAFLWLLFDKDSQNKKDFEIKTLDATGRVLPGLDHEVEGTLLIDGKPLTLRKVFAEKWTKKRGSATAEFTGHTTDYFVNGVPAKQKEYKAHVDALVNEDIFKLLTSPTFFNEQMDWKKRRKTLLEVSGDVTDEEVIASNESLTKLPSILADHSIDDHRKIIAARRTEINKELEKIPVRIDEVERSKPNVDGLSEADIQSQVDLLKSKVEEKEQELSRLQSGGEVSMQGKHLRELEGELLQIKNDFEAGALQAVTNQRIEAQQFAEKVADFNFRIQRLHRQVTDNEQVIQDRKDKAAQLRAEWNTVNAEAFESVHDENCPTCGQSLPAEQIQAAHDKALADFNRRKSERLETITKRGKEAMAQATKLESENISLLSQKESFGIEMQKVDAARVQAEQTLEQLKAQVKDATTDPAYIAKQKEIEQVKTKISALHSSVLDDVERVRRELMDLRDELRHKDSQLSSFGQIRTLDKRIVELKQQERTLAAEYERLEEELYLTEEFIRTKVNLLESRINSKFKYARFKLFEEQINGGLAETCETLYEGVPYSGGLNNAARINVGLDIINTLSDHYHLTAPIFVDNREAVTRLIESDSQIISLIVSEKDKVLRVETGVVNQKEAV